jgi:hypothetical protein
MPLQRQYPEYPRLHFTIIPPMTENYQAKRERMQKALESLPPGLRSRISLRNAEAVAALPPLAQSALASALDGGLVKVSRAIELLSLNPQASLDELLPASARKGVSVVIPVDGNQTVSGVSGVSATMPVDDGQGVSGVSVVCLPGLTALIRDCYPDMPQVAAEALAGAPAIEALRAVFMAQEALFSSRQVHSDFVIVIFFGLLQQTQERLNTLIAQSPTYQQALRQSGVAWKS